MKNWCYVKTADGQEGYVEIDDDRSLSDQVGKRAVVIIRDLEYLYRNEIARERMVGIPLETAAYGLLALLILLIVAIFG
ncbi:MAG TPA: hypothetical protein DCZ08_03625 [Anaerolineaceae bacterium]|nr:hypothetical protein [Anaerolineaceae bacterium]